MKKMNKQDWRDLISFTKDELRKAKKVPTNGPRDEFIKNFNVRNLEDDLGHSYNMLKSIPDEPRNYRMV